MLTRTTIENALLVIACSLILVFVPYILLLNKEARRNEFVIAYTKAHVPFLGLYIAGLLTPATYLGVSLVLTVSAIAYFEIMLILTLQYVKK